MTAKTLLSVCLSRFLRRLKSSRPDQRDATLHHCLAWSSRFNRDRLGPVEWFPGGSDDETAAKQPRLVPFPFVDISLPRQVVRSPYTARPEDATPGCSGWCSETGNPR